MSNVAPRTKEKGGKLRRVLMALPVLTMMTVTSLTYVYRPADAAEAIPQRPARKGRIVMYVQDAPNLTPVLETAKTADQINYAFALIEDGKATLSHAAGLKDMTRFLRANPQIDGILSVGGWGADGFSQACATEEGRAALADSILALMDQHGFVGVDIDWEYPGMSTGGIASSEDDVENWYALLSLLRDGLNARQANTGRDYLLSVALGAGEDHAAAVDGARLAEIVDQAVVMAYDLRGFDRLTGHHAGLYPDGERKLSAAWTMNSWADNGIPEGKLLMGMPLYGRVWRQVSGGTGLNRHAATSGNRVVTQSQIAAMIDQGATRHWDDKAQAAYLYDGENFVSYEDEESARIKADWAVDKGLLGIAMWCGNQDVEGGILQVVEGTLAAESFN